jgi:hypothetical protein
MDPNTVTMAIAGGALIGGSAGALALARGRIAGNCGIVAGLFGGDVEERPWRRSWTAGLLAGGLLLRALYPASLAAPPALPMGVLVLGGLLVGFGTRLANGCTSGHGVCGVGRLSPRSIVATALFLVTAALTVPVERALGGWSWNG